MSLRDRRSFLAQSASVIGVAGLAAIGCSHKKSSEPEEEITPVEDLMREHGLLRRIMYVYDEAIRRLEQNAETPLDALGDAAAVVRRVIEDYHEQIEEQHVFPRFEEAKRLTELVATLRRQHAAGRAVTTQIRELAKIQLDDADRNRLVNALRGFNHMYRPHAAREDTDLFPLLREVVGAANYRELGDRFEEIETEKLGEHGFEHALADVEQIERAFGLSKLGMLMP